MIDTNGILNLSGLAIMDEKLDDTVIERIPVVCSKDNLLEYVRKNVIDEVMIKMPENRKEVDELTWTLLQMGVVVHIALDYTDRALTEPCGRTDRWIYLYDHKY